MRSRPVKKTASYERASRNETATAFAPLCDLCVRQNSFGRVQKLSIVWHMRILRQRRCALCELSVKKQKYDYDYEHRSLHSLSTSTMDQIRRKPSAFILLSSAAKTKLLGVDIRHPMHPIHLVPKNIKQEPSIQLTFQVKDAVQDVKPNTQTHVGPLVSASAFMSFQLRNRRAGKDAILFTFQDACMLLNMVTVDGIELGTFNSRNKNECRTPTITKMGHPNPLAWVVRALANNVHRNCGHWAEPVEPLLVDVVCGTLAGCLDKRTPLPPERLGLIWDFDCSRHELRHACRHLWGL
jgi:hypothetical protein